VFPTTAGGWL